MQEHDDIISWLTKFRDESLPKLKKEVAKKLEEKRAREVKSRVRGFVEDIMEKVREGEDEVDVVCEDSKDDDALEMILEVFEPVLDEGKVIKKLKF
jgi:hypothetical protein